MKNDARHDERLVAVRSRPRCASLLIGSLVAILAPACGPSETPSTVSSEKTTVEPDRETTISRDDILGAWEADLEHDGRHARFAVEFVRRDDGTVIARISMPPIDVWNVPAWPVTREGDEVRMGGTTLTFDARRGTLSGIMPDALVPVHRIPLLLRRVGSIEGPAADRADLPGRDPLWTFQTGGPIWAGVTHADGTIYAGSDDGLVYAIDAKSGNEAWRFASQGAIRARPILDGHSLLAHSDDGYLFRLDAGSGAVEWRVRLGPPLKRVEYGAEGYRYDGYASAPAVADGVIYVSHTEGRLLAIDAKSGEERWEFRAEDQIASTPLVNEGRVYFGSFDGRVRAVDAGSGALIWEHPTGAPVSSSAAWHDGKVIIGSRSYDLLALNAGDGSLAWNDYFWFSWIESSAVVRDGIAYIGSSDSQLLSAIDAGNGRGLWSFDTGGSAWAEPAVGDDAVFIGAAGVADYMVDHRGGFYAVDRASGRGLWRFPSGRSGEQKLWGFTSSPATGDGMVFVGGLDGRIYAFSSMR